MPANVRTAFYLFETTDILSHGHVLYSGQMSITYI